MASDFSRLRCGLRDVRVFGQSLLPTLRALSPTGFWHAPYLGSQMAGRVSPGGSCANRRNLNFQSGVSAPGVGTKYGSRYQAADYVAIFNPLSLAWSFYVEASYAGAPWTGQASAGSSSGRNLVTAGSDPTTGTAVDGRTPASLNGTSNFLQTSVNLTSLITTSAATIFGVYKPAAAVADPGAANYFDCAGILMDNGSGQFGVGHSSVGIRIGTFDGGTFDSVSCTDAGVGNWSMFMATIDSTNLEVQVNQSGVFSLAHTLAAVPAAVGNFGVNYNGLTFFNGDIALLGVANTKFSSTDYANLRSYLQATYPSMGIP